MPSANIPNAETSHASEMTTLENRNRPEEEVKQTPLPWSQLSILYLIETAEALTTTVIFPFINELVRETGITQGDERRTGYFAGIIQGANYLSAAFAVLVLGMASDRFGRRPVLVFGTLCVAPLILAFGISTQFWPLVILRFMQGGCNGNMSVVKTMIGEIADSTNIAEAFAYFPVAYTAGTAIGPFIGGLLSHPENRWPDTFGKFKYLQQHPYFLPCLTASMFSVTTFVIVAVALKETLPSTLLRGPFTLLPDGDSRYQHSPQTSIATACDRSDVPHYGATENSRNVFEDGVQVAPECGYQTKFSSPLRLLKLPNMKIILINFAFLGFCSTGLFALNPLMWSTSIELGGLGWPPYTIGMTMTVSSIVMALVQIAFLGKLIRHFGPRKAYIGCFSGMLVSCLSFPVANAFARRAGGTDWRVWIAVIMLLAGQIMRFGAYASLQVIITTTSSRSSLGTANGLGQGVAAAMNFLAPLIMSTLHSESLQRQVAGGHAVYYIMATIVAYGIRLGFLLPRK